jgi:transcriptional regulator with XRE-family HTH domain
MGTGRKRRVAMDPARCRQIRQDMGLTQEQFAGLLGVQRNTVTRWEIDLSRIPSPTAIAINALYQAWLAQRGAPPRR